MRSDHRHPVSCFRTALLLTLLLSLACMLALSATSCADRTEGDDPAPDTGSGPGIEARRGTHLEPGLPLYADLDDDGILERVLLGSDGRLTITDGSTIYQTRDKWSVLTACLADTYGDGLTEIVALVDSSEGRHLALWGAAPVEGGYGYRERLVTSPVAPKPAELRIIVRRGGDLVVLTAEAPGPEGDLRQTTYRWNGFSFTVVGPLE